MTAFALPLLFALHASPARTVVLSLGNFQVPWEQGWRLVQQDSPIRYAGSSAGVTVDLKDHGSVSEQEAAEMRDLWRRYANEELPNIVRRHGVIVVPLAEEKLSSGYTLFSIAGATKEAGSSGFTLLFVSISPEGRLAQFAVEGLGDPKAMHSRFRGYLESGRWKNEAPRQK